MSVILQIFLSFILISQNKIFILPILLIILTINKFKIIWLIIILVFFLIRLQFPILNPNLSKPFIVINHQNNHLVLRQGFNHYSGFYEQPLELGSKVLIKGDFNLSKSSKFFNYQQINHQFSGLKIENIKVLSSRTWLSPFLSFTSGRDLIHRLFFHQSIDTESQLLTLLVSTGVLLSSLIHALKSIINLFFTKSKTTIIILILLLMMVLISGLKFVLIRLLVREVLSTSKIRTTKRTFLEMIIILFCYPYSYTQLAFIIPYYFRISSFLLENNKHQELKKSFLFIILQLTLTFKVSLIQSFLFRYLRNFSYVLIILNVFKINMTHFNDFLLKLEKFDFIISGRMPWQLTFLIFILFIFKVTEKVRISYLVIFLISFYVISQYNSLTKVIFVDVGQGDSTLLIAPFKQETILIDTGKKSEYNSLKTTLNQYGIKVIDYLIITHPDNDHNGNIENLMRDFKINNLIQEKNSKLNQKYFSLSELLPNLQSEDSNDQSLILKVDLIDYSFLFTGDISKEVERLILEEYPFLEVDVLKLGHHGSRTSSDEYFLKRMNPTITIISSDPSVYNHPHLETLNTLLRYQIMNLKTYEESNIVFNFSRYFNWVSTSNRILVLK